jgi:hypothetical protein
MPPKKSSSVKPEIGKNGIINFYEIIPKKFLKEYPNPNYNIHNIKTPFRMCVVAPSGSGKTNFLLNLIRDFCTGIGTFDDITIITRNKDEPLYNYLSELDEQIRVVEGLSETPDLDKFDKNSQHLVIWDDLVLSKDLTKVENYYLRARKMGCSCIFLSQIFYKIPHFIRQNCSYLVILKLGGKRNVSLLLSEFSYGLSKDQILKMYDYATSDKLLPLIISVEEPDLNKKFRKGMTEYLNPENFN